MSKDVYRIQMRKQTGRGKNGQFTTRQTDPRVIQVDHGSTEALVRELVASVPKLAPGAVSRVDRLQVEFIGTMEADA